MRRKPVIAALLLIVAPLCASGLMEITDIGRSYERSCGFRSVRAELSRTENGYVVQEEAPGLEACALLAFYPLKREYDDRRFFFPTRYYDSRYLSVAFLDSTELMADSPEREKIRALFVQNLRDRNEPTDLIAQAALPDLQHSGVCWSGVYFNGLLVLIVPLALLALPFYVIAASSKATAKRRTAAGHCLKCDYDMRGGGQYRCPECGWQPGDEGQASQS